MRLVCAGHILRWSSGSSWNTARIPLESICNNFLAELSIAAIGDLAMICAKDMHQHILSQWLRDAIVAMFGICARYAPATFLARHLDPAGTRPGSHQIPSGASVCVRGMRCGRNPSGKGICARYAPATFLARHLDHNTTRILLESLRSKGMRQGCALGKPRP